MIGLLVQGFSNIGLSKAAVAGVIAISAVVAGRQFSSPQELFIWTTEASGYTLDTIAVEGRDRTSVFDLQSVLHIEDGMPIFAIDLVALKNRVESLPWVKEAQIKRNLPGDLHITITERHPVALWQINGKVYVIDDTGTAIATENLELYEDLVLMVGEEANNEAVNLLSLIRDDDDLQGSQIGQKVKNAVRVSGRRWDLEFDNGLVLHLPADRHDPQALLKSWKQFKILTQKYGVIEREIAAVDLRQKDRIIFQLTKKGKAALKGKEWQI